eukprot:scaffold13851_cov124-Isochrysis_galbana.AAC.1
MAPSKSASREVAKLTCSHLTDGRRGLDRGRDPSRDPLLSERIVQLFHSGPVAARVHGGRRLVPLHSSPNIFLVERFLSPCELEHLDSLITARRAAFKQSFTDDAAGKDTLSWERTSLTLMLPKSVNAAVRAIEARATDLVGLPPDHIEPLQVVSYAEGARFDLHHDLGVLHLAGDDAEEDVLSVEPAGDPISSGAPSPQADPQPSDRHRPVDGRESELQEQPAGAAAHGAGPRIPGYPAPDARDEYEGMSVEVGGGPRRVVTIFVYLNTLPNGVGHTEFPQLGLSVRPKCGSALLFCNVLRDGKPDPRTAHRAAPVTAPHRKLGCNLWLTDVTMQVGGLPSAGSTLPRTLSAGGGARAHHPARERRTEALSLIAVTTHPVARAVTTHPVARAVTTHPAARAVTTHPVARAVTTHPVARAVTAHPVARAVTTHP